MSKVNNDLKTLAVLRDKEANDDTLSPAERRTYKRILRAHPWLLIHNQNYLKGYRD